MKRNLFYVWHVKANWAKHQNVHCEEKRAEKKRAESMWEKHAQNKPLIFSNWKTLDLKFMLFFSKKPRFGFLRWSASFISKILTGQNPNMRTIEGE